MAFASQQTLKGVFPPQGPETHVGVMSYMLWRFMAVSAEGEAYDLEPRAGGPMLWLELQAAFAREEARRLRQAEAEDDEEEALAALAAWRRETQEPALERLFPEGEARRIRDHATALAAWRYLKPHVPAGADAALIAQLEEHLAERAAEDAETLQQERG